MNWTLVSMPSAGLGGIARGGVRMDKRGVASRLYGGEYGVNLHFLAGILFLLFLLVLGQEEVQEEGHDEADGVGRLQEDDRRRPVRVRALVVLGRKGRAAKNSVLTSGEKQLKC